MIKFTFLLGRINRYLRILTSNTFMHYYLKIHGVQFGKRLLFDGFLRIINKTGKKSIIIGNHCRFNSSKKSNIIGINHSCIFSTHHPESKIKIGNNCGFSATVIGSFNSIEIGNNVQCGANTLITDGDWHMNDPRVGPAKPIKINNNVWLGYGVIVLKGVEIGENTVIGAGSVVTKNIPANVIAGGNPCKVLKELS